MGRLTVLMAQYFKFQLLKMNLKESATQISWDATSDIDGLEGYQLATSEFVDQYTSEKAKAGKVEKLLIAEINLEDGSNFQLPVVEKNSESIKKEKAQTKVATKLKFPAEKIESSKKTVINIRPFVGKESINQVPWDST